MKYENEIVRLSASDLSNHLNCGHVTTLDYSFATGAIARPDWTDPDTAVLQQLGFQHEERYLGHLAEQGLSMADLRGGPIDAQAAEKTLREMKQGTHVIAGAPFCQGRWVGRADVLRRVDTPSDLGQWSYEVYDCKLAHTTKAATVLQLSLYSDLLATMQGITPKMMYVVSPSEALAAEPFPVLEYAAYYRFVKTRLEQTIEAGPHEDGTTAEPNPHCQVCRWWKKCHTQWRRADHLSLVAGISRLQRKQLECWQIASMARLAKMPLPLTQRPDYGSKAGYEKIREQARLQVESREKKRLVFETFQADGLARLPEPSPGDIFFDLEGDYFANTSGLEYLFGFAQTVGENNFSYQCRWSLNSAEEKIAFEWFIDTAMKSWSQYPAMHIYHFSQREPAALKRLMGKYATREDEVDRMLRGRVLVDLHTVVKQSIRASVEEYSLKSLESFYNFERATPLDQARQARRIVEHGLELGVLKSVEDSTRTIIEGYNQDDCISTAHLRHWLEECRTHAIAEKQKIDRPEIPDNAPSAALDERQQRVAAVFEALTNDISADPDQRTPEQSARWLLANLLDWHRREEKTNHSEFYRLKELPEEELLYERSALWGLRHQGTLSSGRGICIDRYQFVPQETDVRPDDSLHYCGDKVGTVVAIDLAARLVDIKKTKKTAQWHPSCVYAHDSINGNEPSQALLRLAEWVRDNGVASSGRYQCSRDLLLRRSPRLRSSAAISLNQPGESPLDAARRILPLLDSSFLAIQGPPGSGKTFTAATMICDLVRAGKRVGVTGPSHKVIRNLLNETVARATKENLPSLLCVQKVNKKSDEPAEFIQEVTDNGKALTALQDGSANVLAGTAWLWSREEFADSVDVLFVDEAGQMSLANVLALSQSAKNLILLGDPQQLEQPLQGSHPDGAAISALEHVLEGNRTIATEQGLFLEATRRLHPQICAFTSELFYDGRLQSAPGLEQQQISRHPYLSGSGLRFVAVHHEGNQNAAKEEADVIEALVNDLLKAGTEWVDVKADPPVLRPLSRKDILIIAPYNAQVSDIASRLPGIDVGTVDRFQGREAAIVIYSLTTSSPEEAPRGMEFLYSLNRLNVATSRGRALCILVGSPRLLEPQCHTPRQIQLANALCRFAELAGRIEVTDAREGGYRFLAVPAA